MAVNKNYLNDHHRGTQSMFNQHTTNTDSHVRWIYEQYHSKKAVTMDDLKYLWEKDPESCRCLIHSVIENKQNETKDEQRIETERDAMECIEHLERAVNEAKDRMDTNVDEPKFETIQTLSNIKDSLQHIKEMVQIMDETQLDDMMEHLYHVSELRSQYEDEFLGWEMLLEETDRYYVPYKLYTSEFYV